MTARPHRRRDRADDRRAAACRAELLERCARARPTAPRLRHAFIRRFDGRRAPRPRAPIGRCARRRAAAAAGRPAPSRVKDLFDVAGEPTTRRLDDPARRARRPRADARPSRACAAPARRSIGHTNMTEFAFSGVGINPHSRHAGQPGDARRSTPTPRIPGGSTSGGAVSVAAGAAWAALGSDTGGSIRIPAALQGLVGFKSTARLVPTEGAMPLSTTLDTVCAITRSVRDAVAAARGARRAHACSSPARPLSRAGAWRCRRTLMLDGAGRRPSRAPSSAALAALRAAGAHDRRRSRCPSSPSSPPMQRRRRLRAAESWAWHRRCWPSARPSYDPRVALRIRRGETMSAADYIDLRRARGATGSRAWTRALRGFDALLSPDRADRRAAARAAGRPATRPSSPPTPCCCATRRCVNLLDGCALSLPCHARRRDAGRPDGLERRAARRRGARRLARHRSRARRAAATAR